MLLFVYQVPKSRVAIVTRFGKLDRVKREPGPGLRFPWPIENVLTLDQRVQSFEGKDHEFKLPDQNILFLSVYVGYSIDDPKAFFGAFFNGSITDAESKLEDMVHSAKNEVCGQHPFSDFVSTDERQIKLAQIEQQILDKVQIGVHTNNYGIDVKFVQIKKIGLPHTVTKSVFDRMTQERQFYIDKITSQGNLQVTRIKSAADREATNLLSDADAKAIEIRGEGEAQMMKSLVILQQNPALATFNMQMTALEQFLKKNTTLVLEPSSSPLEWLQMAAPDKTLLLNDTNSPLTKKDPPK